MIVPVFLRPTEQSHYMGMNCGEHIVVCYCVCVCYANVYVGNVLVALPPAMNLRAPAQINTRLSNGLSVLFVAKFMESTYLPTL